MNRRLALLLLIATPLSTGCWNQIEVNDLAIVSMVGLDRTEAGEIRLAVQVVLPRTTGGDGQDGGAKAGPAFITLQATGQTVLQAARTIQTELPRRLFLAHARVVLISERLARAGLRPVMDSLTRQRELRLNNYLLLVPGALDRVMSSPANLERLPAEYIREVSRSRIGTVVTVGDWLEALTADGADPIMGVIEAVAPPGSAPAGQRMCLRLTGTALFRKDRLAGILDDQTTQGLTWLRQQAQRGVVTVAVPKVTGVVSLEWISSRTNRFARWENGRPVIHVEVRAEGDISEEQAGLDLSDPAVLKLIEVQMNREIHHRMEVALSRMRSLGVDGAGLGEVVHRRFPAAWRDYRDKWQEEGLQRLPVVVRVDAKVRRTGMSNKPKGYKDEELIKGGR